MEDSTCAWPECERPTWGRGLCERDYQRARKVKDFIAPWGSWADGRSRVSAPCRWPDCSTMKMVGNGLCRTHYHRAYRLGDFKSPWTAWEKLHPTSCVWPECEDAIYARRFCVTHYYRADLLGDFDEPWHAWAERLSRACLYCGGRFTAVSTRQAYCSKTCARYGWTRANPERHERYARANRAKRRALVRGVDAERVTVDDIRLRSGDDCYICGEKINFRLTHPHPKSPSIDHVVPL